MLISGATGGVGSIAVQLAAPPAPRSSAPPAPGQEEDYVRGLGADTTVDYTGDIVAAVRAIAPRRRRQGPARRRRRRLIGRPAPGGTVATTLGASARAVGRTDVTVAPIMAAATAGKLAARSITSPRASSA